MHAAILAAEGARQSRNGRLRMEMDVAQKPIALASHYRGQGLPAFERQDVLVDARAALCPVPSIEKSVGILFQPAADNDFGFSHQWHPMCCAGAISGHPPKSP